MAPKIKWVIHPLSGVPEPSEIHWLIDRLTAINRMDCPGAVLAGHAYKIHGLLLGRQGRDDHSGHKIRRKNGLVAERVDAMRGARNDLIRLRTAAESGSERILRNAWLGVAGDTRRLVLPPPPPIVERQFDQDGKLVCFRRERFDASKWKSVKAGRFYSLIPKADAALPLIESAIRKLDEVPAAERQKRKRDPRFNDLGALEDELEDAVRNACRALTGRKGFKYKEEGQKYEGPLVDLGHDIDVRFGTKAFTINRLRKKFIPGLKNKKPPRP
jgi:hypothetical protein